MPKPKTAEPEIILAEKRVRLKGLTSEPKPVIPYPKFPTPLSVCSLDTIGDVLGEYAVWRNYTEDLVSYALANLTRVKHDYDMEVAKAYIMVSGKNNTERDAKVSLEPNVSSLAEEQMDSQIYYDMVSSKLGSIEKSIATLSREISRRSQIR